MSTVVLELHAVVATVEDVANELGQSGLDACTLNNALNIAQLVVLVALLKWVRNQPAGDG